MYKVVQKIAQSNAPLFAVESRLQ